MTKDDLISGFEKLGIKKGMSLEVHSSLSSFGYVQGGAEAVIDALKESVGSRGSIFMPALRLSKELPLTDGDRALGITSKIKVLPENRTKSAMGIIADTFRMKNDTVTGSGIIQTAGWGLHAEEAAVGGLDYVLHNGGKALLLGVDIYKLTAMHYVETNLPEDIKAIFAPTEEINKIYPPDKWFVEAGCPPVKAWYTIQSTAIKRGLIKQSNIGNCNVMFFDLWDVVSIYEQELKNDPYKLYGISR